jgi:hypothetical protein
VRILGSFFSVAIAPDYRALWFTSLWSVGSERKLQLTPISDNKWSILSDKMLSPLESDASRISGNCSYWTFLRRVLGNSLQQKERKLVRSFLQQPKLKIE